MTHNSDGEETRPYTGGAPTPAPSTPPPGPTAPWTPPSPSSWQPPFAAHTQAPSPAPGSGHGRGIALLAVVAVIALAGAGVWIYRSKTPDTQQSSESPTETAQAPTAGGPSSTASPTTTPTSEAAAPSAASPPRAGELAGYLPDAEALQKLLLTETLTRTADAETTYTSVTTDRPDCGGAPNVALPGAYERSGYTGIHTQEYFSQPAPRGQDSVTQAVVAFPSEQQAKDFVSREASRWGNCKYDLVTISNNGEDAFVRRISNPTTKNGVLTVSTQSQVYQGLGCQRGLGSRHNIVIDVQVCSPGGSAQAADLVSTIAHRIPNN